MGLIEMKAVLAAEHPMSGICHCSTLSLLVKCVTFTSVLASVHQMSHKALLPHSVWCTLSKSGLVAIIISGLLNNKELRIWKAENVYYSYPGVKTSSVSAIKSLMQWLGWSNTTPGSTTPRSLPQQDCGRPKGRSRVRYDHHPAPPPECIIQI